MCNVKYCKIKIKCEVDLHSLLEIYFKLLIKCSFFYICPFNSMDLICGSRRDAPHITRSLPVVVFEYIRVANGSFGDIC